MPDTATSQLARAALRVLADRALEAGVLTSDELRLPTEIDEGDLYEAILGLLACDEN